MQPALIKRSIVLAGRKTSVSLEDDFWDGLKAIARGSKMTLSNVIFDIDVRRTNTNLSSAIRIFVLQHFRSKLPENSTDRVDAGDEMTPLHHRVSVATGEPTNY